MTWLLCTILLLSSKLRPSPRPLPKYPALPSETPAGFKPTYAGFDYERRDVMIAMRDGVKLHTVILLPKGRKGAPMLLTRTPYDANQLTTRRDSAHLASALDGYDNAVETIVEGGYIRVVQDIRGKYGSEGDYVMNRPLAGPQNPTPVDHSTDTWDTIDWLVKNVPESNGKVGILGISYDGFLPLMALVNPHPALKVSVPMNPMVDGWKGDDWFHNGAFRQQGLYYIYEQQATRGNTTKWWSSHYDEYEMFLEAGNAGELARRRGMEALGFWKRLLEHPSYDAYWRDQAVDKILAAQPLKVPVMLVHSLWDQEDIYGAPAVWKAIKPKDTANDKVFLVMGPWHHGQEIHDGSALGAIRFDSDTGLTFRREILRPFLDQYLKDGAPKADIATVMAFETGTNKWRRLPAWPAGCASGCTTKATPLYLGTGGRVGFEAPKSGEAEFTEYVSDPAKPVPYIRRPVLPESYDGGAAVAALARDRPARRFEPPRRRDVRVGRAVRAGQDQRRAGREPRRLHERDRLGLGREADRRLAARGGRRSRSWAATSSRSRWTSSAGATARASTSRRRSSPTSRSSIASACRRRTTCSCRGTGSWCRSSRAGSRSTTAIRRPSCRASSGRSPRTTGRRRSASTTGQRELRRAAAGHHDES